MRKKYRVVRHEVTQPLDTSYRLIPLTRNQNAIVDVEDFEYLSRWNWLAWWNPKTQSFYATRKADGERRILYMHRVILHLEHGDADHEDHNTLDNRKRNLRPCNRTMNNCNKSKQKNNKSGFKGVIWYKPRQCWIAQTALYGQAYYLGGYKTAEAAACAYDLFALLNHKEFARTNLLGKENCAAQV